MWLVPSAQEKVTSPVPVIKGWVLGMKRVHWWRTLESQTCWCCCQVLGGKEDRSVVSSAIPTAESIPTSHFARATAISTALTPAKWQQCWCHTELPALPVMGTRPVQKIRAALRKHICKTGCWWAFSCFSEGNVCKMPLGKSVTGTVRSFGYLVCRALAVLVTVYCWCQGLIHWCCSRRPHLAIHNRMLVTFVSLQVLYLLGQGQVNNQPSSFVSWSMMPDSSPSGGNKLYLGVKIYTPK